jgi:hypothetical protein
MDTDQIEATLRRALAYLGRILEQARGVAANFFSAAIGRPLPSLPTKPPDQKPGPPRPQKPTPGIFQATAAQIVAAVKRAEWRRITLPSGASVEVMLEPAREGDLFLTATYRSAQTAADELGASLLTPMVSDAIYAQADSQLVPCILPAGPEMASLEYTKKHSACILAQLPHGLVANAGKNWVRGLKLGADQAANHGWYDAGAPNGRLWQDKGRKHNRSHVDYSQTVTLMRNLRDPKGDSRNINEVLRGPDWAMLGSEREAEEPVT